MNLKDTLEIILITYNRKSLLEGTFKQLLDTSSPLKDLNFTILDNCSTDGTSEMIEEYSLKYSNIKHIRNQVNIGPNANIATAFKIAKSKYFWILCDDDFYDFSNWKEVEMALQQNAPLICVAHYDEENKNDIARTLLKLTFLPSMIVRKDLLNYTLMRNIFDNIYTMFPHLSVAIDFINKKRPIYVIDKSIVINGLERNYKKVDYSYTRDTNIEDLSNVSVFSSWITGYASIIANLKDKEIRTRTLYLAAKNKNINRGIYKAIKTTAKKAAYNHTARALYYNLYNLLKPIDKFVYAVTFNYYCIKNAIKNNPILTFKRENRVVYIKLLGKFKKRIYALPPKKDSK